MSATQDKPNILFIFSDQHRWCDLGCYGNEDVISPNFDIFCDNALRFNNCISNSPVCVPARGSMLTGLFPLKHGAVTNDLPINKDTESMANVLNAAGYTTGYIGKWHLGGIPRDKFIPVDERLTFKEWKVCNCNHSYMNAYYYDENNKKTVIDGYEPKTQTDLAIDFISRNKVSNWYLTLSYGPPHDPYHELPQEYIDLYKYRDIKLRDNVGESAKLTLDRDISHAGIINSIKGYYAHITALDEQFGRIIKHLEKTNQLDNTIVVYTSDHGDMLGSQGLSNKQLPFEESIKIPLMIYWKGHTLKGTCGEMLGLVDLPTSLLGLIGQRFKSEVDGKDLHELFIEKDAKGLDECYIFDLIPCHQAYARGDCEWRGIKTRSYTYTRTPYDDGKLLFDNINDPNQKNNLIKDPQYSDIKKKLDYKLNELASKHDDLITWDKLIIKYDLLDQWNKSQEYFHLPILKS